MDSLLLAPLLAGVGVALAAGPIGCVVIWRRMSYLGDTISHSALLGVSLAVIAEFPLALGVFAAAAAIAVILLLLEQRKGLSTDAILGILSHASLAFGLVSLSFLAQGDGNLMKYLLGEILFVSWADVLLIYSCGAVLIAGLSYIWKTVLADTACHELAKAEGMNPEISRVAFMLMLAGLVAITMKIVGILLITALLIIPAATARRFATNPEQMAVFASVIGMLAVGLGIAGSLYFNTPTGPSIVGAAFVLFAISLFRRMASR